MRLSPALTLTKEIIEKLRPACMVINGKPMIEVAGSVRRKRPIVGDIDLVVIPENQGQLIYTLQSMGRILGGDKVIRVALNGTEPAGAMLDVYVATPENWPTIFLIRTGSAGHNVKMCRAAKEKGFTLHADGRGLCYPPGLGLPAFSKDSGSEKPVPGITCEKDIFYKLGMHYAEPWEREV
jgi:DNA polymerase/3'-5' exonuclease PolX